MAKKAKKAKKAKSAVKKTAKKTPKDAKKKKKSRFEKIAGSLMPATSQEPSGRSALLDAGFSRKARVDERGCRRDIRSNGRIAVSRSSLRENPIRQKKQVFFVRCGSHGPQFHRPQGLP